MNNEGRIPFSAIGILLVCISIITSFYMARLDYERATDLIKTEESDRIRETIPWTVHELERLLDFAGMRASHYASSHPVMIWYDDRFMDESHNPEENYYRYLIGGYFRLLIEGRFPVVRNGVEINVIPSNWTRIKLEPYTMVESGKAIDSYYTVNLPVIIELKKDGKLHVYNTEIKKTIRVRYPYILNISRRYYSSIDDTGMMKSVTPMLWATSWIKGYTQFLERTSITNVVSNDDLEKMVNLAVLEKQSRYLGTLDGEALIELGLRSGMDFAKWKLKTWNRTENYTAEIDMVGTLIKSGLHELDNINVSYDISSVFDSVSDEEIDRFIRKTVDDVYTIDAEVISEKNDFIYYSPHPDYPFPAGSSEWRIEKVIFSGSSYGNFPVIYREVWKRISVRDSFYRNMDGELISVQDRKTETIVISFRIIHYSITSESWDDVHAFSRIGNDPNLEDAVQAIKDQLYEPNFKRLLNDTGAIYGRVKCQKMPGLESDIKKEIINLKERMKRDTSIAGRINPSQYPDPVDALQEMKRTFEEVYDEKSNEWISIDSYVSDGKYISTSYKARATVKKWYVEQIRNSFKRYFDEGAGRVNSELENQSSEIDLSEVRSLWKQGKSYLSRKIILKSNRVHVLKRIKDGEEIFTDNVSLSIKQNPPYLISGKVETIRIDNSSKDVYPLSLLNICTLNDPTLQNGGLRILPSEPWITTLNIWVVSVRGEYMYSGITDENSTVFLDHNISKLSYTRKHEIVHDPFTGEPIGENTPLKFNFTTVIAIIVPPGPQGIGDLRSGMPIESSGEFQTVPQSIPTTERK